MKQPIDAARTSQIAFTGMRDSADPSTADPRKASLLENVYPQDPEIGGGVVGRPGCQQMGVQLGGAGNRRGQAIYQFTELDGTEHTLCFVAGGMHEYNWGTSTWSAVPLVGVSLPTTGRIYCTTFADELIVNPSDGTRRPFSWDGSSFTDLSNAPVSFGRPIVYYAKLIMIEYGARTTFDWSEENAPNTGYQAGGYTNFWQLGQTDQEALVALHGTNEALYYWRTRSTGAISGAVTPTFRTTGTHEGVSQTIGTASPDGVIAHEQHLLWLDADARHRWLPLGGSVDDERWRDMRETSVVLPKLQLANVTVADYSPANLLLVGVADQGSAELNVILAYHARTGEFIGRFATGWQFDVLGMVKDASGNPVLMHLGANDGYAYQHGNPGGAIWDDGLASGTAAIGHKVWGTALGYDAELVKYWPRLDISFRMASNLTNVSVRYRVPGLVSTAQTLSLTIPSALWDVAQWDVGQWGEGTVEKHAAFGWNGVGRWLEPRVEHAHIGERFGLLALRAPAYPVAPLAEVG